jgi:hypothetical protein
METRDQRLADRYKAKLEVTLQTKFPTLHKEDIVSKIGSL